jgi:hypothetical protein
MTITLYNRLGKGTHRPRYAIHATCKSCTRKTRFLRELQRAQTLRVLLSFPMTEGLLESYSSTMANFDKLEFCRMA